MLQNYYGERGALTPDDEMSGESRDEPARCVMQRRERNIRRTKLFAGRRTSGCAFLLLCSSRRRHGDVH